MREYSQWEKPKQEKIILWNALTIMFKMACVSLILQLGFPIKYARIMIGFSLVWLPVISWILNDLSGT